MTPSFPPVNGEFVTEGMFLAMPVGFPGVSAPVPGEVCRLHTICHSKTTQQVYAVSRGPQPHLYQFAPKGTFGFSVDLGLEADAEELVALTCRPAKSGGDHLLLAARTESGSRLIGRYSAYLGHGIQEWHVTMRGQKVFLDLPTSLPPIGLCDIAGTEVAVFTGSSFFRVAWKDGFFSLLEEVSIACNPQGFHTIDGQMLIACDGGIHTWNGEDGVRELCPLPQMTAVQSLVSTHDGFLWADTEGTLWQWSRECGLSSHGRIPLLPVHSLVRLSDGRVYASAGPEIAHWYLARGQKIWALDLGVPVSTLSSRRYGFLFGHLIAGSDGEIYCAEDDRGGHLWIYYPPIS